MEEDIHRRLQCRCNSSEFTNHAVKTYHIESVEGAIFATIGLTALQLPNMDNIH
jgi:hypothetical protein